MEQNWQALADAVKNRRRELGMTQPELTERSRRLDQEFHPDAKVRNRGLSVRTWSEIERAIAKERRGRTQFLIDATLKWPRGTARALLHGEPLPDGPPLTAGEDDPVERAAERAQEARWQLEVAELRAQVAEMVERQYRMEKIVQEVLGSVGNGS